MSTNKTARHSRVVLIGSQCSTVTVSRYYFRINRISDRIRYSNTQVSIQITGQHVCSGAFIHESWIITVASCVFRYVPLRKVHNNVQNVPAMSSVLIPLRDFSINSKPIFPSAIIIFLNFPFFIVARIYVAIKFQIAISTE